jgi:hypothetical protein
MSDNAVAIPRVHVHFCIDQVYPLEERPIEMTKVKDRSRVDEQIHTCIFTFM